ncbi:hypothetical protein ACJJTC_015331 [Scirpophaga incertulas]
MNFAKKLENNQLNIPQSRNLPYDMDGQEMPFVFVGDEAFALSRHIMRPRRNLSVKQRVFNYRLTRARRIIECTFGILANKWRILHRPLDVVFLVLRLSNVPHLSSYPLETKTPLEMQVPTGLILNGRNTACAHCLRQCAHMEVKNRRDLKIVICHNLLRLLAA